MKKALDRLIPEQIHPIRGLLILHMDEEVATRATRARFANSIRQALGWRDPVIIVIFGRTS